MTTSEIYDKLTSLGVVKVGCNIDICSKKYF